MAKLRQFIRGNHGQGLAEFALVLPILLVLLFGITEFGRVYGSKLIAQNASREGARYAAVHTDKTEEEIEEKAEASALITSPDKGVADATKDPSTGEVTVKVTRYVTIVAPLIENCFPSTMKPKNESGEVIENEVMVTGITVMRLE